MNASTSGTVTAQPSDWTPSGTQDVCSAHGDTAPAGTWHGMLGSYGTRYACGCQGPDLSGLPA